jgi:anti-sigma factor RsiW
LLLEAYALQPEPVILFNLARAYEGLGDLQKAIEAYGRYLDRDPSASDRKSIEQRIATLKKQVDDVAALEKQRDEERARAIEARRAAADAERRAELEEQRKRRPSAVPWVVAGVGVLGVGVGLVLGVVSHDHYASAVSEPFKSPAEADYAAARNFANGANAAFVAGGVIAAAGASWGLISLFSGTKTPAHPAAEAVVSPRFVGLTGRF